MKNNILKQSEKKLITDFNNNYFKKPKFDNVIEMFEKVAKKWSRSIAIEHGEENINYNDLDEKTDAICNYLNTESVDKNVKVCVFMDRGIDVIIAILGILKARRIVVPIDPEYQEQKVKSLINIIEPSLIITQKKYFNIVKKNFVNIKILVIDAEINSCFPAIDFSNKLSEQKIVDNIRKSKCAYIYFTSGSTGTPKAVLEKNINLAFSAEWMINKFSIKQNCRVGQLVSISFHMFFREVFIAICSGATLCIPENKKIILDPSELVKWFRYARVNLVHCVSLVFKNIMLATKSISSLKQLKHIIVFGDRLKYDKCLQLFFDKINNNIDLTNIYGQTEAPLKFYHRISTKDLKKRIIPIGKPIEARALILSDKQKVEKIGVAGEIYIRSPYLADGYYKNNRLTKKVFIQNPFIKNTKDIVYKTGDLGKLTTNGEIECLGRINNQIKINGVFVNLDEIEACLLSHDEINSCVVVKKEDENSNDYLVAYYISTKIIKLKNFLENKMPDIVVPDYFIRVKSLPYNINGKIDRKKLEKMKIKKQKYATKSNQPIKTEDLLIKIWQDIFDIKQLKRTDNFFSLGGHSLKAIKLINQINVELNANLSIIDLFSNPTVDDLRWLIEKQKIDKK